MRTMNYLLLLDDLWDKIELEDVGVPSPTRENGCKIVATTRSLLVCKKMCTDEEIKVEVLSDEEAWNLFCKKVCDVVDYPSIQPLAKDVVQECGGLPLAIIVIGGSLRKEKDVQVWSYALRELKNATFELHDMEELVFKQLKFSYDQLHDDNLKRCFLYCALYPEGFEINALELIENWWAEGFIDGVQNLGDAHDKGYAIVNDLINASLLERIEGHYHLSVKMHDVIRDLALRIGKFLVRAGVGMEEPPNEEEWREVEGISLMYNNLKKLPKRPECTSLSTLLLQCNRIKTIPKLFFVEMLNLRVLNLSWNWIRQLPMQVGHLKRLEMLHLQSGVSGILYLPSEVGLLTRLRSLRVTFALDSYTSNMVMIPNGVLTSLSLLEDLIINVCGVGNAMLCLRQIATATAEVANLKYLNSLEFPFARKGDLEHFLERSSAWKDKRLKSFEFLVGDDLVRPRSRRDDRGTRYLKLEARNNVPSIVAIEKVLIRCSAFTLQHHGTIKKILDISDMVNMQGLKFCLIAHCNAIETFVDVNSSSSSLPPPAILPNLEDLGLVALPQLRTIWKGPLSLTSLRNLELSKCPKLTNVFSRGMTQQLSNLEGLTIDLCQGIEEIVTEEDDGIVVNKDDEEIPVILFPRLKALHLLTIPKLVSICKGIQNPIGWPSLMKFHISGCPNLKRLPLSIHNAPVLTSIGGGQLEWWESLEWDDDDDITKQQLPYLFKGPDFW